MTKEEKQVKPQETGAKTPTSPPKEFATEKTGTGDERPSSQAPERKFRGESREGAGERYSRRPRPENPPTKPYQPFEPVVEDVGPPGNIQGEIYKTGKRKNAIARVWVKLGKGEIVVNKKPMKEYFTRYSLQETVVQPFALLNWRGKFDIKATTRGGGISGQAQALRFGISRALAEYGEKPRAALRKNGNLTRDSRVVERKKYGLHKARRAHQFSKR